MKLAMLFAMVICSAKGHVRLTPEDIRVGKHYVRSGPVADIQEAWRVPFYRSKIRAKHDAASVWATRVELADGHWARPALVRHAFIAAN